jgi:hypothetical protein
MTIVLRSTSAWADRPPAASGGAAAPGAQNEIARAPGEPARTPIPEPANGGESRQYFFLHDNNYFSPLGNELGRLSLRVTVRQHNFEVDAFYPILAQARCWFFAQLFHGQAERLITASESVTHVYAGLGFQ